MESRNTHRRGKGWVITNNGALVFTYKEALDKYGISRAQFRNAIDDLISNGFLEITHQGTGTGDPSTFKLTERWQAYGTDNFNPAKPRRKNTAPNRGWRLYNKKKKQKSSDENTTSPSVKNDTSSKGNEIIRVSKVPLESESHYADIN